MKYNRRTGSGRPTKLNIDVLRIVELTMRKDDGTTAVQLYKILLNQGHDICLATILNSRKILGWTFRGSAYYQLIRPANNIKRLE